MVDFTDLQVWKRSRELANGTYALTKHFPPDERNRLTDQLRRATASVLANLAEGNGRQSPADQARCYRIALGSARETKALLILSQDQAFMSADRAQELLEVCEQVQRMLVGLLKYCRRRQGPSPNP